MAVSYLDLGRVQKPWKEDLGRAADGNGNDHVGYAHPDDVPALKLVPEGPHLTHGVMRLVWPLIIAGAR